MALFSTWASHIFTDQVSPPMDSSLTTAIISSLITAAVTSPLTIWFFKRWLKNRDARELAQYKTQLAIEQDQRQAQFVALH